MPEAQGDVPGIVRAELLAMKQHLFPDYPGNPTIYEGWRRQVDRYLSTRFDAPSAEGGDKTPCGMGDDNCRDGVTGCTRSKGHPGPHYDNRSDRSWPVVPPPSATGCNCNTSFSTDPKRPHHQSCPRFGKPPIIPCTACGCAACRADRVFVRALAESYTPRSHSDYTDIVHRVMTAARAVTEAR